jgi:hypothetical protein
MVVLHCKGRKYDNDCLITFKVGPLRTQTHLLHRSCHCWKHRRKASFGIFRNSAVAFEFMFSMVAKSVPARPIFRVGNSPKPLGTRSGEYGGWVMTQQAMCGSVRCRDAETTVPACHLSRRFPRTASHNLCKTCTKKWPVILSRRYEIGVKKFRELFDWPSYLLVLCMYAWHLLP